MNHSVSIFIGIFLILTTGYIACYSIAVAIASKQLIKEIETAKAKAIAKSRELYAKSKKIQKESKKVINQIHQNIPRPTHPNQLHPTELHHPNDQLRPSDHPMNPMNTFGSPKAKENIIGHFSKQLEKPSKPSNMGAYKDDFDTVMGLLISSSIAAIVLFVFLIAYSMGLHFAPNETFGTVRWNMSNSTSNSFVFGIEIYIMIAAVIGIILQSLMLSYFIKEDNTVQSIAAMILRDQNRSIKVPLVERIESYSTQINHLVRIERYLKLLQIFSWTTLGLLIPIFIFGIAICFP